MEYIFYPIWTSSNRIFTISSLYKEESHSEMVVALCADMKIFLHISRKEHSVAFGAFYPHFFGNEGYIFALALIGLKLILRFSESKQIHIFYFFLSACFSSNSAIKSVVYSPLTNCSSERISARRSRLMSIPSMVSSERAIFIFLIASARLLA